MLSKLHCLLIIFRFFEINFLRYLLILGQTVFCIYKKISILYYLKFQYLFFNAEFILQYFFFQSIEKSFGFTALIEKKEEMYSLYNYVFTLLVYSGHQRTMKCGKKILL